MVRQAVMVIMLKMDQHNLNMDCKSDGKGGTNCSGKSSDGTTFAMSCATSTDHKLKCKIGDSLGEKVTMNCELGANGVPVCIGLDNKGTNYDISCSGPNAKSTNCKIK